MMQLDVKAVVGRLNAIPITITNFIALFFAAVGFSIMLVLLKLIVLDSASFIQSLRSFIISTSTLLPGFLAHLYGVLRAWRMWSR